MPNFNQDHPDDVLLEDARMQAASDREGEFVADLLSKRQQFGMSFRMTTAQREWLEKIAYGSELKW